MEHTYIREVNVHKCQIVKCMYATFVNICFFQQHSVSVTASSNEHIEYLLENHFY